MGVFSFTACTEESEQITPQQEDEVLLTEGTGGEDPDPRD